MYGCEDRHDKWSSLTQWHNYQDNEVYLVVGQLLFVLAGIYFSFVMLISAISVSMTMLVLCVYHQAPSHDAATCIPVPRWVSTASYMSVNLKLTAYGAGQKCAPGMS